MPAVDITEAYVENGTLNYAALFKNDVDKEAEATTTLGGPGINFQPDAYTVPPQTIVKRTYGLSINQSLVGETLLITSSLTEPGINTGDYPSANEQRQVTIDSMTQATLSQPITGQAGEITSPPGSITQPGTDPSGGVTIEITNTAGRTNYAWMSYNIINNTPDAVEVTVSFTPSPQGNSTVTVPIQPGQTSSRTVEWTLNNQSTKDAEFCVNKQNVTRL